ncbi:hypothetical protein MNV49_002562 [Pseudohyphozyma bogoriensis]|nr:hypothetical protein MNV49_002562 [Pseudohyphozyma bogoriensis]
MAEFSEVPGVFKALPRVCVVLATSDVTVQAAHWINTIRDPNKTTARDAVVRVLKQKLQVVPQANFQLDDPSNLSWLRSDLHIKLDLYAIWCLLPSDNDLDSISAHLEDVNEVWQNQMDEFGPELPPRDISFDLPAFENTHYQLLILHQNHFLPTDLPLPILRDGSPLLLRHVVEHRLRADENGPDLPPFPDPIANARHTRRKLNPLLVTMNGAIKIRHHLVTYGDLQGGANKTAEKVLKLEELIYAVPEPREGSKAAKLAEMG